MKSLCLFFCGFLFFFISCKNEGPVIPIVPEEENSTLILTEKDNDKEFNLEIGKTFQVALNSNPTTGYTWEIVEIDEDILSLKEEVFVPNENEELVGAGGVKKWTFKAVNSGSTTLKLVYKRSWEEQAIKEFTVTFTVN